MMMMMMTTIWRQRVYWPTNGRSFQNSR